LAAHDLDRSQTTTQDFMPWRAPRWMRIVWGLAELGIVWCSKPEPKTDAWGLPGTANCCCEHVLQPR
jgi:hypothetical protein